MAFQLSREQHMAVKEGPGLIARYGGGTYEASVSQVRDTEGNLVFALVCGQYELPPFRHVLLPTYDTLLAEMAEIEPDPTKWEAPW